MPVDRYTKIVLTVVAVALVVIAVNPWLTAMAPDSNGNLLLQAEDGTLREVDVREKSPRLKAQVRWN